MQLTDICSSQQHTPEEEQADVLTTIDPILSQKRRGVDNWEKKMNMVEVATY